MKQVTRIFHKLTGQTDIEKLKALVQKLPNLPNGRPNPQGQKEGKKKKTERKRFT